MRNLYFLALGFCFLLPLSVKASPKAPAETDEQEEMYLLSYQDFRLMSNSEQDAYIKEMQNIMADLTAKGIAIEPSAYEIFFPKRWSWLQELINTPAEAAGPDFMTSVPDKNGKAIRNVAKNPNLDKETEAKAKTAEDAKTKAENARDYQTIFAPQSISGSPQGPINADTQYKMAPSPSQVQAPMPPRKPAEFGGKANAKDAPKGKLRCIYAGFTLQSSEAKSSDCAPKKEYKIGKDVYACNKTANSTILPEKPDPKISILCNPVLFGLIKDKPICIAYADRSSSTKKCLEAARKDSGSLDAARKLMHKDKASFELIKSTMENFCGNNAKSEAYLKDFADTSKRDIKATCVHYAARFNDFGGKFEMATWGQKNNTPTDGKPAGAMSGRQ